MTQENMLRLLILQKLKSREMIAQESIYSKRLIWKDYVKLKKEFLEDYTLDKDSRE